MRYRFKLEMLEAPETGWVVESEATGCKETVASFLRAEAERLSPTRPITRSAPSSAIELKDSTGRGLRTQ